jgi:hypothetical protein
METAGDTFASLCESCEGSGGVTRQAMKLMERWAQLSGEDQKLCEKRLESLIHFQKSRRNSEAAAANRIGTGWPTSKQSRRWNQAATADHWTMICPAAIFSA